MMAKRKCRLKELAEAIGITEANLSILKNGKAKAIRLATLEAICAYLNCQPGDILEYQVEQQDDLAVSGDESPLPFAGEG
ncbi:helix-turn-helix transcriptional regulator [Legionella sp. PATHC035]|nr:helix-turn-helix transcriptional regulator [Legionella sp. PATHC035]MCW8409180.1 helix-turn-helix transcriptional regulator [Legionella sp. PATHC035]